MENDKIITIGTLSRYNENIQYAIDSKVQKLMADVQQMIDEHTTNHHIYCTNNDILRLFDASIPEEPVEPDTPETPTESIGSISEDNSIVIDETKLDNGTYTLRYIDANENVIDNFNEITSFEINK
jgi:hypothetical protein